MNKKGKRNKGNAARPSKRPTIPSPASTPTPSSSAYTPSTEVLLGQDLAVAAAVKPEPPVSDPELEDTRDDDDDDDQEESGPRIVAHVGGATPSDVKHEQTVIVEEPPPPPPKAREEIRPAPAPREAPHEETESIPPVSSRAPEAHELDHDFFVDGEKADKEHREAAHSPAAPFSEAPEEDPKATQKMTPAVRARRARFTKYVKWAVGASAIVCLAALVRVAVARGQREPEPPPVAAVLANAQAAAPQPPPPQASPPVKQAVDTPPPAAAPAAPAPAPTDTAPAAAAPADTAQAAAAPADVPTDPAAAKEEKKAARKALERGDLKGAIEAGERAVAYDPTDGDSWLLLGAAYQEKGKAVEARKAFTSCIKEGKRGPIGECRKMLR